MHIRSVIAVLALVVAVGVASTANCRAEGPFSLSIAFSSDRVSESQPLYFSIRLKNETKEDAELERSESFTFDQGDVAPLHRQGDTNNQWKGIRLSPAAGTVSPFRVKPRVFAPGETLEVIECLIPASLCTPQEPTPWEFKGAFLRRDRTQLTSEVVKVSIIPEPEARAEMLQAAIVLFAKGPQHVMDEAEKEAVKKAAERSPAIARIVELFERFDGLRKYDPAHDQKPAMKEFAALVEKLPPIEREHWAYKFANIHFIRTEGLLHRDVPRATFHLDMCAALDKALGTTTANAQGIRQSCAAYRERIVWYAERKKNR